MRGDRIRIVAIKNPSVLSSMSGTSIIPFEANEEDAVAHIFVLLHDFLAMVPWWVNNDGRRKRHSPMD